MSKQFDELAKALAKGTSRRSAIQLFLAGIGAALAGVFLGRGTAQAGDKHGKKHRDKCKDHCHRHYGHDRDQYDRCCDESENCNDDCCAIIVGVNSTEADSFCVVVD